MNCPDEIVDYMHEYLDEEISKENEEKLREHLQNCTECHDSFHQLKKAIALVQSTSHIQAPTNFTSQVMASLPKEKKKVGVQRWFRHHPLLTAASLFIVLMMGSVFSSWNQNDEFSFSKQPNVVIENNTVIVPKGEVIKGDIIVRNGDIKIEGQVDGNVTVINGQKYLASAGQVSGEIEEINVVFEWIWYHIKKNSKEVINVFNESEEETIQSLK